MAGKGKYKHTGGGCLVGSKKPYPCDDTYESKKKIVNVITTKAAHFSMPDSISSPSQLGKMKGVKSVKVEKKKKLRKKLYEGMG